MTGPVSGHDMAWPYINMNNGNGPDVGHRGPRCLLSSKDDCWSKRYLGAFIFPRSRDLRTRA